jgi:CRP-like cAMP-binding protein
MTQPAITEYLSFFKDVSLFENLSETQIKKIMTLMSLSEVKKGEVITREGEAGNSMFILIRGEVEISKGLVLPQWTSQSSFRDKALIRLSEKQHAFFGEMALFMENPERSATIKALRPCILAVLQKSDLLDLTESDQSIGSVIYKNIAAELTRRLIKSNKDILKLTTAFSLALEGE